MSLKEFLESYRMCKLEVESKKERIEELRSLATSTQVSLSESHGKGGHADKVGRTAARIADMCAQLEEDVDILLDRQAQIMELISELKDATLKVIMTRHYIQEQPWEFIAEKVGYSPRHVTRLHNQALEILEPIYEKSNLSA